MWLRWLLAGLIVIGMSSAVAEDTKALYEARCSACHQASGGGQSTLKAPNISGFTEAYLHRQLTNFKNGLRGAGVDDPSGQMMRAAVLTLSPDQLDALASYVSQLPDVVLHRERQATGFRGRGLYSVCSGCHGSQGEGNEALGAPRLNQQYRWYLIEQLNKYRNDIRGNKPQDEHGQQMRAMAKSVEDADIELLVRHISGLGLQL